MKNSLERVKENAESVIQTAVVDSYSDEQRNDIYFHLGEIGAASTISRSLESAVIIALQRVRDEKKYLLLGFQRFDEFLDSWHHSPMKYKRFNYLEGIHASVGSGAFDLMRGSASYRQMKMLEAGDIEIEGNEILIGGDERVPIGDSKVLKPIIEKLIAEKQSLRTDNDKLESKVEKQADQIKRGTEENEELRRSLDAIDETTHFERTLMNAVDSLLLLQEAVGQLDDSEKKARGGEDLKLFAQQYYRLSDAYGVKRSLTDAIPEGDTVADRVIREMVEDGSFEDMD